jgi:uncharacterized paraquat-inducible protein A
MLFRNSPANRITRLVAAVVLACLGGGLLGVVSPPGLIMVGVGLAIAGYQGVQMWRERPDPYDLSRLWDKPNLPEEPEEDGRLRELAFCHRCGASMSTKHSICPQCGVPLGQ